MNNTKNNRYSSSSNASSSSNTTTNNSNENNNNNNEDRTNGRDQMDRALDYGSTLFTVAVATATVTEGVPTAVDVVAAIGIGLMAGALGYNFNSDRKESLINIDKSETPPLDININPSERELAFKLDSAQACPDKSVRAMREPNLNLNENQDSPPTSENQDSFPTPENKDSFYISENLNYNNVLNLDLHKSSIFDTIIEF